MSEGLPTGRRAEERPEAPEPQSGWRFIPDVDSELRTRALEIRPVVTDHFVEGPRPEESAEYRQLRAGIGGGQFGWTRSCRTREDLDGYFNELVSSFELVRDEEHRSQLELGNDGSDEARTAIDRTGATCVFGGTHRLSIARVRSIQGLPALVKRSKSVGSSTARTGMDPRTRSRRSVLALPGWPPPQRWSREMTRARHPRTRSIPHDEPRVLHSCRAMDSSPPFTAARMQWVSTLASHPAVEQVQVLTPRLEDVDLPENVAMSQLARRPRPRLVTSFNWQLIGSGPTRFDLFFIAHKETYPALLPRLKIVTQRPHCRWKAMPHLSRRMRLYLRWCDDLVFTATDGSLLLCLPNKRVVGLGLDAEPVTPSLQPPDRDFLTIGRISPVKHMDKMIRAIAEYRKEYGSAPSLDIVNRISVNGSFVDQLKALVAESDLGREVGCLGHVESDELPRLLPRCRASLSLSGTVLDKAVGESMACGVPELTADSYVMEIAPADPWADLVLTYYVQRRVRGLHRALTWDPDMRMKNGGCLRAIILAEHSLATVFDRIISQMEASRRHSLATAAAQAGRS